MSWINMHLYIISNKNKRDHLLAILILQHQGSSIVSKYLGESANQYTNKQEHLYNKILH